VNTNASHMKRQPASPPSAPRSRHGNADRRGSLLFEVVVSAVLLAVILLLIGRMAVSQNRQAARVKQQSIASQIVQNQLELAVAQPWVQITAQPAAPLDPAHGGASSLADAQLTREVVDTNEGPPGKQVTVVLSWTTAHGIRATRSLTTWVYPARRAAP